MFVGFTNALTRTVPRTGLIPANADASIQLAYA
jgi:hypothetical protein